MGLFGLLGAVVETGLAVVVTPIAVADDLLSGGTHNSTADALDNVGRGVSKTIRKTVSIVTDPLDEDKY